MHFDYCPNCTKHPAPLTQELFEQLIRQPWLAKIAEEIAAGNLDRKRDLPAACWQAAFGGQKRANTNALPSGLFALDVDHVDDPLALYQSFQERTSELGIYIVHKTPSTRGLRIVALCRPEFTTIAQNQAWLAQQIHVEHDAVTRDFARLSFLVPESYFYFYNPSIFTDEPVILLNNQDLETSFQSQHHARLTMSPLQGSRGGDTANDSANALSSAMSPVPGSCGDTANDSANALSSVMSPVPGSNGSAQQTAESSEGATQNSIGCEPYVGTSSNNKSSEGATYLHNSNELQFKGIPYSQIVDELIARTGGEPYEGERNNRLYLICRLLANITDRQVDKLFQVCPRFGLSEAEVRACCESACKSARTEKLPYVLYKVLKDLSVNDNDNDDDNLNDDDNDDDSDGNSINHKPSTINLPDVSHLPPLIREFVETSPEDFREATALSCLPICGFLGSRLRARYSDGELQAPSFIVNVIAPAASGKGSLLRIADMCLSRVRAMDDAGREEEAEFMRQSKLKKNEKKQLEEPTPIVRDIPAKVSVAQLLKRMVQARGLHLISISSEADTLTNSNKAGAWAQKSDIYRIAQDTDGGRYGQDYKSDASFSATCQMRYNLLTLGTPGAIARAYPDVEDGLITRCIMIELPSQFGKQMPVRRQLTARQERTIHEKVDALMRICQDEQGNVLPEYHLNVPWLREGMDQWVNEQRLRAVRDDDHARDQFMRRAALIGFRAGMVAAFLWGRLNPMRKQYTIEFAIWVSNVILQSLLDRYAAKVNEQAAGYEAPKAKRYPSLFEALPDIFTLADLRKLCAAQSIKSPLKSIIFRWTENKLIEKGPDENFVKLTQ